MKLKREMRNNTSIAVDLLAVEKTQHRFVWNEMECKREERRGWVVTTVMFTFFRFRLGENEVQWRW
jgi:hypothetical protein